jgi:hypothetical protein
MAFQLKRHGAVLKVKLFDFDDLAADDPLGHVVISLSSLLPGVHEGWWPLHDPNDNQNRMGSTFQQEREHSSTSSSLHAGPAVRLRITFEHSPVGELCSYLWEPPKKVKPTIHRFDPNILFLAVMTIQTKLVSNVTMVAMTVVDAITWSKGPTHTFIALAIALFVCNHIDRFWVLLHGALAASIVGTGIATRFGKRPLKLFPSALDAKNVEIVAGDVDHHEESAAELSPVRRAPPSALSSTFVTPCKAKAPVTPSTITPVIPQTQVTPEPPATPMSNHPPPSLQKKFSESFNSAAVKEDNHEGDAKQQQGLSVQQRGKYPFKSSTTTTTTKDKQGDPSKPFTGLKELTLR